MAEETPRRLTADDENDGAAMDAACEQELSEWAAVVPTLSSTVRSGFEYGFELGWRGRGQRLEADRTLLTERLQVVYRALKKLNLHHKHDHHHDDPAMPMDSDVAAGYLAYDNRPRHWWANAIPVSREAQP